MRFDRGDHRAGNVESHLDGAVPRVSDPDERGGRRASVRRPRAPPTPGRPVRTPRRSPPAERAGRPLRPPSPGREPQCTRPSCRIANRGTGIRFSDSTQRPIDSGTLRWGHRSESAATRGAGRGTARSDGRAALARRASSSPRSRTRPVCQCRTRRGEVNLPDPDDNRRLAAHDSKCRPSLHSPDRRFATAPSDSIGSLGAGPEWDPDDGSGVRFGGTTVRGHADQGDQLSAEIDLEAVLSVSNTDIERGHSRGRRQRRRDLHVGLRRRARARRSTSCTRRRRPRNGTARPTCRGRPTSTPSARPGRR